VEYQQHHVSLDVVDRRTQQHGSKPSSLVKTWVSLQALHALGNYGHLSYEKQQELLQELGNIDIGVGTLQATNSRMFEAINPSVNQLREWVQMQPTST